MHSVKLTSTQKLSYYILPIVLAAHGLIPLYFWMADKTSRHFTPTMAIAVGCSLILLAFAAFLSQRKSLGFYSIPSDLNITTKTKIIKDILREHNWTYTKNTYALIQAKGDGFRKRSSFRAWFEWLSVLSLQLPQDPALITIELSKHEIKINSICNPDSVAAFSFGKNRQNIRDFEIIFLRRTAGVVGDQ